jgi:hypothetical protein
MFPEETSYESEIVRDMLSVANESIGTAKELKLVANAFLQISGLHVDLVSPHQIEQLLC